MDWHRLHRLDASDRAVIRALRRYTLSRATLLITLQKFAEVSGREGAKTIPTIQRLERVGLVRLEPMFTGPKANPETKTCVRLLREEIEEASEEFEPTNSSANAISSLGNRVYQAPDGDPVTLTEKEDSVLQAFIDIKSMNHPTLVKESNYDDAAKVLKKLAKDYPQFAPFIHCPGGKGRGGYRVLVTNPENCQ